MSRLQFSWSVVTGLAVIVAVAVLSGVGSVAALQDSTPTTFSCDAARPMTAANSPEGEMEHEGMNMGTPPAMPEFDQMYIDMMIPHHASIMAMAEAALPRLQDERLRAMAEAIIAAQGPEIEELRGYREQFYGSAEPEPMDDEMMGMMEQMMPGMAMPMDKMMETMDPATQVAMFCTAADPDLAFIDL